MVVQIITYGTRGSVALCCNQNFAVKENCTRRIIVVKIDKREGNKIFCYLKKKTRFSIEERDKGLIVWKRICDR